MYTYYFWLWYISKISCDMQADITIKNSLVPRPQFDARLRITHGASPLKFTVKVLPP